jgi:CheY-like chemotaxis protein
MRRAGHQVLEAADGEQAPQAARAEQAPSLVLLDIRMPRLRVLSEVGLVRCRAEGRRRLYRLEPARLRPLHQWLD